jgi:hypothetical protein
VDVIMGCNGNIFLPEDMVNFLWYFGSPNLSSVNDPKVTLLWRQGWKSPRDLGLEDDYARFWEIYASELHKGHIRLSDQTDKLIWSYNKQGGYYTVKLGYQVLFGQGGDVRWWWKALWKVKALLKEKLSMWLTLLYKVLTWDQHLNRGKVGLNRCPLCLNQEETNTCLFLS